MNDPTSDEELVRRSLNGDESAFGSLIERHQDRVYRVCLRVLRDSEEARDAAQDTFLTVFRKLAQFRGDAAFTTWLHRIAVNSCYDALRSKRRRPLLQAIGDEQDGPLELGPPVDDHADEIAGAIDVESALAAIAPDHRIVLTLADIEDLPYEQIATILDLPIGTVKSRVHRGRVALAQALGIGQTPSPSKGLTEPAQGEGPSEGSP